MKNWFFVENEVVDDKRLSACDVIVYVVLARYASSDGGECFPSISTLVETARMSRQGIINAIRVLEKYGYLKKEKRKKENGAYSSNLYVLTGGSQLQAHG